MIRFRILPIGHIMEPTETDSAPVAQQVVTHPAWCDPDRCIPPLTGPARYNPGPLYREHRSAPVTGSTPDTVAYLSQMMTPWETNPHLQISEGRLILHSIELDVSSPLLLMMRQVVADQQARYPELVPDLGDAA